MGIHEEQNQKQFLKLERDRLLKLLMPVIFQTLMLLESNRKNDTNGRDDELKFDLIRLLGGSATVSKNWLGDGFYKINYDNNKYDFARSAEFDDWFFNVLLTKVKAAKDFPLDKLQTMELHGITFDGTKYLIKDSAYYDFNDALYYAEQLAGPSQLNEQASPRCCCST
jgi:hypothetical protein